MTGRDAIQVLSESSPIRLGLMVLLCGGVAWLVSSLEGVRGDLARQASDLRSEIAGTYVSREYLDARLGGTERVLQARIDALSLQISDLSRRLEGSEIRGK